MASEKKSGPGNRRDFVRLKIPLAERIASVVIIALLAGIGIFIAIKGKHFDPHLYNVRTEALRSTAAAVVGKDGTARSTIESKPVSAEAPKTVAEKTAGGEEGSSEGGMDHSAAAPKTALKNEPLEISLPGIKPM